MIQALFLILLFSINVSFSMGHRPSWDKAMDHAITKYGLPQEQKIKNMFEERKISFPPYEIALLAFKKEKKIELWGKNENGAWARIHNYPLAASSGKLGPKLKENDLQIPEGIYHLTEFNPFSNWHLSMMIDYPNEFDKIHAKQDGRKKLGYNIFIHGKSASAGCLAIGNKAIDALFLLVYRVGLNHVKLIIAPNDLRVEKPSTDLKNQPKWLPALYYKIKTELKPFKRSSSIS